MSKSIIIYSSKYGSTADCAQYLKEGFSGSVSLADIGKTNLQSIGLDQFDTIIIGSSIYIGKISRKIRALCIENSELLLRKRVGIFICCAVPEQMKEYLSENFSDDLLRSAIAVECFGGEARIDNMKVVDKLIIKAATKGNINLRIVKTNMDNYIKAFSVQ